MGVAKYISQLGRESLVYGISGVLTRSIGIFLIPLYTRVFSPSDYGIMSLINTLVFLISPFVVLGLDNSAGRWFYDTNDIAHQRCTFSSWFWCQITVSSSIVLVVYIHAPQISALLFKSGEYTPLLCLALGAIPLLTFQKILGNLLQFQRRAWATSIFWTLIALVTIGITILLVLIWRWGLVGVYSAKLIAAILAAIVAVFLLKSWISPYCFSWSRLKPMLVFGLPLVPAAIAHWVTNSSDRWILKIFWDTSEIGLYSIGATLAGGLALITSAFQMALGPFAFSIHTEKDSGLVYAKVLILYVWVGCFFFTCLSLFAPLILRILTTKAYYPAATCVPFLTFSVLLIGVRDIASLGSVFAKKSVPVATSIFISAGINIALNFAFIPEFGREGAAFASMVSWIMAVVYLFFASQRNYYIPYRFGPVVACMGFSWALIAVNQFMIPSTGILGFGLRIGLCSLFLPLGFVLGFIRVKHYRHLIGFAGLSRRD